MTQKYFIYVVRKIGFSAGFIALILIVSCKSDGCEFTYSKYYIENYVDGDLVLLPYCAVRSSALDLPAPVSEGFGVCIYEGVYYQSPELEDAQYPDEFLRIAERNGDTEFNDLKSPPEQGLMAFADNFAGIRVTSDKDWSAEYPAGTPLNDKMGVRYVSYAEYIENDYHSYSDLGEEILFLYNKPLSALQPDDLRVVEYTPSSAFVSIDSFILYFTSAPDNPGEEHTFTVEFTTSDGTVKTASITCTPEVDPALQ